MLVTTQSPHIASVANPRSLIVLRSADGATTASTAHDADLSDAEWADIGRYLDTTRAEMVFARAVLLVEELGEEVLLPTMADQMGMDLDKLGITVCAIHGTHFGSYVAFCNALGIRWAVVTDGDTTTATGTTGQSRAQALLTDLGRGGTPAENGIFVGDNTFEYDVAGIEDNHGPCYDVLTELCAAPSQATVESWKELSPDYESFMKVVTNAGGKGHYAQRLALRAVKPPAYIAEALSYLAP